MNGSASVSLRRHVLQGLSKDISRDKMPSSSKNLSLIEGVQNSLQNMWGNSAISSWMRELNGPDISREGTLSSPSDRSKGTSIDSIIQQQKANGSTLSSEVMQHAFHPESGKNNPESGMRLFVPGLNTPEAEATRRTQVYADVLEESMVHMHNGTHLQADLPYADQIDYVVALTTRMGIKSSPLIDELTKLLSANFQQETPEDIHAILYSDSTIAGTQAISKFRRQEIARRMAELQPSNRRSGRSKVTEEVDALLKKHLFVEMHGNAVADLPVGPRYLVWTDDADPLSHKPIPGGGKLGLSENNKDDNPDAVYIDYDGPFDNFDAHNLAAGGMHVVKETLRLNEVSSSQELYEKARSGAKILVPKNVAGNPKELWNPHNNPNK